MAGEPQLLRAARAGDARFFIQFGGQGNSFLRESRILSQKPELNRYFEACFQALADFQKLPIVQDRQKRLYEYGFDLKKWINEEDVPPERYLARCTISFPANQVTQLGYFHFLTESGYPIDELLKYSIATTGHSQGLQAAVVIALGHSGDDFYKAVYDFVYWFGVAGFFMMDIYGFPEVPEAVKQRSIELDKDEPTPMAVVANLTEDELAVYLDEYNKELPPDEPLEVSLKNTETVMVITGHARDLAGFRARNFDVFTEKKIGWSYVGVSGPFHRPHFVEKRIHEFYEHETSLNFPYKGSDLKLPVISFFDGSNLQDQGLLSETMAATMVMRRLDWDKAIDLLFTDDRITHVLDFGPGKISSMLTRSLLGDHKIAVMSAVGRAGMRKLLE